MSSNHQDYIFQEVKLDLPERGDHSFFNQQILLYSYSLLLSTTVFRPNLKERSTTRAREPRGTSTPWSSAVQAATLWSTKATAATVAFLAPARLWMGLTGSKIMKQMRIRYFLQRTESIVMTMISSIIAHIYHIVTFLLLNHIVYDRLYCYER